MSLDLATLEAMRRQHPAWRLLAADSGPLVASFLHRVFVEPNVRTMSQSDLAEALDDTLFALREQRGAQAWPKEALDYLSDWTANERGWLRKFYPPGSDEPHFDLTPATEKAIAWLVSLAERHFVGTESRLLTLFGCHLLPAGDAFADFRALFRWQRGPVFGAMEHVRPFAWRQGIPLMLQRCQHVTLDGGKAAP